MRDGLLDLPSLGQAAGVLLQTRNGPLHLFTYLSYYGFPNLSRHKNVPIWGLISVKLADARATIPSTRTSRTTLLEVFGSSRGIQLKGSRSAFGGDLIHPLMNVR